MSTQRLDPMSEQLAAFDHASTAEEYLDALEISYDPTVVNVYRLHILKRFAPEAKRIREEGGDHPDPTDLLVNYRLALESAYRTFLDSTAMDHRLFKVLADHAPRSCASDGCGDMCGSSGPAGFIPLGEITVPSREVDQ